MKKVRVYELAKELDIESKALVEFLADLGAEVKNHMSTIEDDIAVMVRDHFASNEPEVAVKVKEEDDSKTRRLSKTKKNPTEKRSVAEEDRKVDKISAQKNKGKGRQTGRGQRKGQGRRGGQKRFQESPPPVRKKDLELQDTIVVKELAMKLSVSAAEVIKKLMKLGVMATVTQSIDFDTAALICTDYGVTAHRHRDLAETVYTEEPDSEETLELRPPVVTIMGHVDHGKTTLLDGIRKTKVTETEAGGITQHIGAYQIKYNDKKITFLDTPGHEAFTAMRSRGAQVTDIAILVVAADDGVMPQTVEAINHAKAAGVPIIVAVNKMDRENANPDRVKQELTEYELVAEEWGGETIFVELSALRLEGIDDLLEMILLTAEMGELRANPNRPARGTVIEAQLDKGRGPVATILISNGTLRVGDTFVVGRVSGRVRAMLDDKGRTVVEAGPAQPVEGLGMTAVPDAGDVMVVVTDDQTARQVASMNQDKRRETETKSSRVTLDDLFARIKEGEVKDLNIVLKGDVQGSVEAVRASLEKLSTDEVRVQVIHQGVGAVSETDVSLAAASNAIIVGFNVRPDPNARRASEREGVDIRLYRIIYNLLDDVKAAMVGLLDPDYVEDVLGRAEVRQTFRVPNAGVVAGCYVTDGKITRQAQIRVLRDNVVIHEGTISSLKRFKDDVREVQQNYECGIGVERFNDVKEGDEIEAFVMKEVKRTL